ncbi:transcription factor TGA1-like isoform X3 [Juglans regia]|uniref:Transcription factor TGA1-like isoform X3 n=1 Tax=Juglans regia TaxID=51240 RepID=A0A6P9F7U4_JUGRE|nr:transcription factor TGA1-like isoform X3 [Juglans regia]
MNSPSAQFVTSRRMGVYDPIHQMSMWGENFKSNSNLNSPASLIVEDVKLDSQSEDASHGISGPSNQYDQEATKPVDKAQRRLAQNREAARKSRLRKKAYVQQLETSRLKLIQLEHELECARHQGSYIGGGLDAIHPGFPGAVNPGITTFEIEYGNWVEEQNRQICDLRNALNAHVTDMELRMLVENCRNHYFELFRMKETAAKADVFYVTSGMWKTSAERFFSWIGGIRPSELLKVMCGPSQINVLGPQLNPMTEQQSAKVVVLRDACLQAEDALWQGMERLQQTLAETVAASQLIEGSYIPQMAPAMKKLEALVEFVNEILNCHLKLLRDVFYYTFHFLHSFIQ